MSIATLVTFIAYFVIVLAVGLYCCRKNENIEDYLLGGRRMGAWVTAISAEASDMSGWLLMGLPGAIYLGGTKNIWIAIGLFIGTILNWVLVAGRLRLYTHKTNAITLPRFLEERFGDPTGLLRSLSAVVILVFFTIYASSGLVAAGALFESTFGVPYWKSVLIGGLVTIGYTLLGGYFAVCWTDVIQGMLMVFALVVVPSVACSQSGGVQAIGNAMVHKELQTALLPDWAGSTLLGIVSAMAWGLGYFGQPHILVRFMSVKSLAKLRESMLIISIIAMALALQRDDTILGIVAQAWGGFGAAFGPLILFALFSRGTTWFAALLGMLAGTVVLVVWRQMGWNDYLYEIVPGFVANALVILVVNRIAQQENARVLQQFDEVARELEGAYRQAAAPQVGYGTGDGRT